MKKLILLFFLAGMFGFRNLSAQTDNNKLPLKTVCIKHPDAENPDVYFSKVTMFNFEVFKPGTEADVKEIIKNLSKDSNVDFVNLGKLYGNFQAISVVFKTAKNKSYVLGLLKKAGLDIVKINNGEPTNIDKI
ncbi:MAG: hypothetical protein JSU07_12090 [Bacteroidetes bacterium]|nr:hypothetical protein [Bacteroidota bacterium]